MKWILALLMLFVCTDTSAGSGDVLLLGDDARLSLPGADEVEVARRDAPASEVASAAARAKHAAIVVDATVGPLPITREHILIARQARVPSLSILLVNTAGLDGMPDKATLIDLQVAEVREIFDKYELDGSAVPLFMDEKGLKAIVRQSIALPARAPETASRPPRQAMTGYIYLLSAGESPGAFAIGRGDVVTLWLGGQTTSATIDSTASIEPGGVGDIQVTTDAPIGTMPGQRFLFERDGKTIALGVVTE